MSFKRFGFERPEFTRLQSWRANQAKRKQRQLEGREGQVWLQAQASSFEPGFFLEPHLLFWDNPIAQDHSESFS